MAPSREARSPERHNPASALRAEGAYKSKPLAWVGAGEGLTGSLYPLRISVAHLGGEYENRNTGDRAAWRLDESKALTSRRKVGDWRALMQNEFSALVRCLLLWLKPRPRDRGSGAFFFVLLPPPYSP